MAIRLIKELEDAIYDWIVSAIANTSITQVVWDKQDTQEPGVNVRPPLPYVLLNIISGPVNVGSPTFKRKSEDIFTYSFTKTFVLSVQVYATESHLDVMSIILDAVELPSQISILNKGNLSIISTTEPVDISQFLETVNEFRVGVDMIMAYGSETDDTIGEIQQVAIDGAVGDFEVTNIIP